MKAAVFAVGDAVEVHTRFNDSWCGGFVVAEVVPGGYRLRRLHDRALLPQTTGEDDLRGVRRGSR